ncbi:hypothetical protein KQY10_00485 [Leptospira interrogans]|uniref:Uncharacterized protein n=1 Tax=Leptospira interrogans serovar Hardjo str. Norma TaxID=1279460 RepID=A0A0M4NLK2_LEPIR|nr:hypothetical protein [Leptospira interrogans]ALE40359.1 hypothetical protein G436_3201 [Leptospira interrogans serovar Hardjo str. Norma]MCD1164137.1 hypothetical protein [Leptospira interrogans]MCH1887154.1 hypothetical protein [Leptospira interrogans]MCH1893458.1 hypothetical protein [Leptospira interrogans]MCH1903629.1 hypothetical protein [Leptospira interrogans]
MAESKQHLADQVPFDKDYQDFLTDVKDEKFGNYNKLSIRYSRISQRTISVEKPSYIQYNLS